MGIGSAIQKALEARRTRKQLSAPGPIGDFWRAGGQTLLWERQPIDSSSLVWDVGGFRGDWCAEALWRYGCSVVVFEAIPEFASEIARRFGQNARVSVVPAALGREDGTLDFNLDRDGSSAFVGDGPRLVVPVADVARHFAERAGSGLACMKVNIEGGEYDLLERMLETGLTACVRSLLIQFHQVAKDSAARRDRVRAELARTHDEVFCFPFVWERWDRRAVPGPTSATTL